MGEWNRRVGNAGAAAPFYAPLRRKTSAEIISEARAAVYGDTNASSGSNGNGGAVRPLRTRRPFTPRDSQRTLFTDRVKKKDNRPPSSFNLLNVSENAEYLSEANIKDLVFGDSNANSRKKVAPQQKVTQERVGVGDSWSGFTKLPQLNGRSKPLHRRNTIGLAGADTTDDARHEAELEELANAIAVTRPLGYPPTQQSKSPEETISKRKQFGTNKSLSCDQESRSKRNSLGDIPVLHLAVQLPHTSQAVEYDNLSILEIAEALTHKPRSTEQIASLLSAMLRLAEANPPAGSLREMALRAIYRHVDNDDERIQVDIARILFTLRLTGAHLATACKLVFKVARNDKNDNFFRNTDLLELVVEGVGRVELCHSAQAAEGLVYGAGAVRFLALDATLRARLRSAGAAHLLALHLNILNEKKAENPCGGFDQWSHALYQITGALRNLAGSGGRDAKDFVSSGALKELVAALTLHQTDRDALTNVVRCLSVVSVSSSCGAWLCACSKAPRALLLACAACCRVPALCVRLAYTLGNLAAADALARNNIYNEEGGMDILLTIVETYTNKSSRDPKPADVEYDGRLVGDLADSDGSTEDVLIKTVRVIANLCLEARVGREIARSVCVWSRTCRALVACLQLATRHAHVHDTRATRDIDHGDDSGFERREELATAALATLNNVTFYRDTEETAENNEDLEVLRVVCRETCSWARRGGGAAREAVRALGNISRSPLAAGILLLEGALEALGPHLEHSDSVVRCAAAGVLVNVLGAGGADGTSHGALRVTARALCGAATRRDAPHATLLARALWNAAHHATLPEGEAARIADALDVFIDDDSVFAACEAPKSNERRASNPEVSKYNANYEFGDENDRSTKRDRIQNARLTRAYSMDQDLHIDHTTDEESPYSGDDQGFEDGENGDAHFCECTPCKKLAAWEELMSVAIPLLEKLRPRPHRTDAAVGTE